MDVLRQVYPEVEDVFLESALYDAHNNVVIALELLRNDIGEPNDGTNASKEINLASKTKTSFTEEEYIYSYGKGVERMTTPTVEPESSKGKLGADVDEVFFSIV